MNLVDDNEQPRSSYYELFLDVPFISEDQAALLNEKITELEDSSIDFLKSYKDKLQKGTVQDIDPDFDIATVSNTGILQISFNQKFKTYSAADISNNVLSLSLID